MTCCHPSRKAACVCSLVLARMHSHNDNKTLILSHFLTTILNTVIERKTYHTCYRAVMRHSAVEQAYHTPIPRKRLSTSVRKLRCACPDSGHNTRLVETTSNPGEHASESRHDTNCMHECMTARILSGAKNPERALSSIRSRNSADKLVHRVTARTHITHVVQAGVSSHKHR